MSELVWGIKNGDIDQVKYIVEKKIDVNALIDGRVPLHYAADYGQTTVLNYLLDQEADPNMLDKHGISVLLAGILEGHTDCVKTLGTQKSKQQQNNECCFFAHLQFHSYGAVQDLMMDPEGGHKHSLSKPDSNVVIGFNIFVLISAMTLSAVQGQMEELEITNLWNVFCPCVYYVSDKQLVSCYCIPSPEHIKAGMIVIEAQLLGYKRVGLLKWRVLPDNDGNASLCEVRMKWIRLRLRIIKGYKG